jgi:enterochelin esterase-like enzyme
MRLIRLLLIPFVASAAFAQPSGPFVAAPTVNPDHTVTFRYAAPAATHVELALENTHDPIPMQKSEAGVWSVTSVALPPEIYSYHFIVDGRNQLDPLNRNVIEGFLAASNTVLVPEAGEPWQRTAVPHGVVHHHTYTSSVVLGLPDNQSDFYVYTPPGYDPRSSTRYPILYLLHGWSDTAAGWTSIGHANDILDNLIAAHKAKPMIIVMPLGYGDISFVTNGFSIWNQVAAVDSNTRLFSQALLTEIMPQIDKLYNVSTRREDCAITGLSMGGLEALTIGLDHADKFAWVGGFSAAVHLVKPDAFASVQPKAANFKLIYISVGMDDGLLEPDRRLAATLRGQGFDVVTSETPGKAHVWQEWRPDLATFAARIFQ